MSSELKEGHEYTGKFDLTLLAHFWRGKDSRFQWEHRSWIAGSREVRHWLGPRVEVLVICDNIRDFLARAHTHTHTQNATASAFRRTTKTETSLRFAAYSACPWLRWRAPNRRPILPVVFEMFFSALTWQFFRPSPRFLLCGSWWDDLNSHNLQPKFACVSIENTTQKSVFFP